MSEWNFSQKISIQAAGTRESTSQGSEWEKVEQHLGLCSDPGLYIFDTLEFWASTCTIEVNLVGVYKSFIQIS